MNKLAIACSALLMLLPLTLVSAAPPGMAGAEHIRGTVVSLTGNILTVQTTSGVKHMSVTPDIGVATIIPGNRSAIKPGVFVGIASVTGMNNSETAAEVVVFPASMRGTGEGSYPWDLPGPKGHKSKMTNGTVSQSAMPMHSRMTNGTVGKSMSGSTFVITYNAGGQSGAQPIKIPTTIPVVTFEPGTRSELVPGAHVFAIAKPGRGASLNALRILVGKNGLIPPM